MSEKTEQPTRKRLADARKKGNVARSKDASKALLIWASFCYMLLSTSGLADALTSLVSWAGANAYGPFHVVLPAFIEMARSQLVDVLLPWMILVIVVSVLGEILIAGPVFSTEQITPSFNKLNVVSNVQNLFSARNAIEALKSTAKVLLLVWILERIFHANVSSLILLTGAGAAALLAALGELLRKMLLYTAAAFTLIALLDILIQWKLFQRQNMMTKDEVKKEHKESEGSPEIRNERKRQHKAILSDAQSGRSRQPTMVVTNPTHLAVGLRYVEDDTPVPQVVVKGAGLMAQEIVSDALHDGIPVIQHIPLARALTAQVEVDDYVPSHLFDLVIDVIQAVRQLAPLEPEANTSPHDF